jgi:hypothetical protein
MVRAVNPRAARFVTSLAFLGGLTLVVVLDRTGPPVSPVSTLEVRFTEVARQAGIDFVHQAPALDPKLDNVAPLVAALGACVSVADVDTNGWMDLFFTNSRFGAPNALYLNRGDGTFREAARQAGLADLNRAGEGVSMGAVWGDYDNDGFEDLLVYRWGYLQLFHNRGDATFEDVTEAAGLRHWMNANAGVWLDYDRDGVLDLYVGGYFRSDLDLWHLAGTRIMHNSFEFATNGGQNRLFHNRGDGTFEDATEAMGVGSTRWTMAVASADFNDDGWPDLYLANDYGPEQLFLNRQGERFELVDAGLTGDSKSGMSVSLGDLHNRGRLDVFVTNISERGYLFHGNNLRLNFLPELDRFEETATGAVADAGWAWGAQFGDLNNDGLLDLFVVNGYVSGDRDRDYWYAMSKVAGAQGNIFEDARNWPAVGSLSLSGYEQSRVLVNRGAEGLQDVAEATGVTDEYDGRSVALADLFNRGVLDVVVANQRGPALLYRNEGDPGRHWIGFRLVGRASNRSAIGAEVTIEFGDVRQRQVVAGGMGFCSQNDRRLHFGLGDAARVDRVTIRWPSGRSQVIERPAVDRKHVVVEGEPVAVRD